MLRDVATACEARPVDLIIYNAGTDVLDGDPLGRCWPVLCGQAVQVMMLDFVTYVVKTCVCECHLRCVYTVSHPYLNRVHVSKEGVCRRDEMVFELALKLRTPVCMLMSGGYARGNWRVVLQSLTNLLTKYNLLPDRT